MAAPNHPCPLLIKEGISLGVAPTFRSANAALKASATIKLGQYRLDTEGLLTCHVRSEGQPPYSPA